MPVNTILVDPIGTNLLGPGVKNVIRYTGDYTVPRNIRQQRANNLDTLRQFGTPVLLKHMFNDQDVRAGRATQSPNWSDTYGQTRHNDPLSHGVGFVSLDTSEDEWISPDGTLVISINQPGPEYIPAPRYRGYGPGYLTYAILPDIAEDVFKLSETGALIRIQTAQAQMGWYPEVNDNDLLIIVQIDNAENIIETRDRYLLKQTNPASMRGLDRKGRLEYTEDFGNRHVTDQWFEMTLIPQQDELYSVEIDR